MVLSGIDTVRLRPIDRFDAWTEEVRRNHGNLEIAPRRRQGFEGRTRVQRAGQLQLMEFGSDAVTYRRRERDARRDHDDTLRVLAPRRGAFAVEADEQRLVLVPGSAVVVSMAVAFTIAHDADARADVFTMPLDRAPRVSDPRRPVVLDLTSGSGSVLRAVMTQAGNERRTLDAEGFRDVADALALLVAGRLPAGSESRPLVDAARHLLSRHADEPGLSPALLARRLGCSLRTLQAATQAVGTSPARLVRDARLDRARDRLVDPAWAALGVADVAAASGFGSLSAFHDAFRRRFGTTPAALRTGVRRDER